jgi:hypothetical protein
VEREKGREGEMGQGRMREGKGGREGGREGRGEGGGGGLSLIHISEPTRRYRISVSVIFL